MTGAVAILAKSPSPPNKAGGWGSTSEAASVTPDFFPTDNLSEAVGMGTGNSTPTLHQHLSGVLLRIHGLSSGSKAGALTQSL